MVSFLVSSYQAGIYLLPVEFSKANHDFSCDHICKGIFISNDTGPA